MSIAITAIPRLTETDALRQIPSSYAVEWKGSLLVWGAEVSVLCE